MKNLQILLSQKYGKGDRKFAEIQGTDLTLGAVGSDKILKENPIWNWRQIDLTPFQFAMKKMTEVMMSLLYANDKKNSWKLNWKNNSSHPTTPSFHSTNYRCGRSTIYCCLPRLLLAVANQIVNICKISNRCLPQTRRDHSNSVYVFFQTVAMTMAMTVTMTVMVTLIMTMMMLTLMSAIEGSSSPADRICRPAEESAIVKLSERSELEL